MKTTINAVLLEDRMQLIFDDSLLKAFLEENLCTGETGRVFAKLSTYQGRFEDFPMIEIFRYLGKDDRDFKRAEADKIRATSGTNLPYQKIGEIYDR